MKPVLRGVVALVVISVLFAVVAVTVGAAVTESTDSQSTVVEESNTTNFLSPATPSGEQYQQVTLDASSAATVAAQEIHNEHESRTFDRRLHAANESEQATIAQEQLDRIKNRFELFEQRQQELFNQYSNGEITSETLIRELIALQGAIDAHADLLERTEPHASPSDEFRIELETLVDAISVEQPVVERMQQALVGTGEPATVYLQSADSALVLASVNDGLYTRQATLLDERDLTGTDQFGDDLSPGGYSEAQQRMEELYPWAYNLPDLQIGGDSLSVYSQIYQLGLTHPHGELTTYFDGATRNVFHENQYMPVNLVPTEATLSNSTDAGTLTVDVTRETGPMRVTVEDEQGSPLETTVEVNEQRVGTTDEDGTLWTVQPTDGFEITVTTADGETITADLSGER